MGRQNGEVNKNHDISLTLLIILIIIVVAVVVVVAVIIVIVIIMDPVPSIKLETFFADSINIMFVHTIVCQLYDDYNNLRERW